MFRRENFRFWGIGKQQSRIRNDCFVPDIFFFDITKNSTSLHNNFRCFEVMNNTKNTNYEYIQKFFSKENILTHAEFFISVWIGKDVKKKKLFKQRINLIDFWNLFFFQLKNFKFTRKNENKIKLKINIFGHISVLSKF